MGIEHIILASDQTHAMIQNAERCVHFPEHHPIFERLNAVHWDDIYMFRTIAAVKSFRKAATKMGASVNTIRARVARLEKSLEAILFSRSRDGIALTKEGLAILDVAIEMQSFTSTLQRGGGNNVVVKQGEMRISCSEGLGEFWLNPRLSELQSRLPDHIISLQNDFDQSRIHSRDHDICIGFTKPTDRETIVTKLASMHLMLFASQQYLEKYGTPTSMNDVQQHKLILQNAPGVRSDIISLFIGEEVAKQLIVAKVNTSHSLCWSIANGAGVGALPTYAQSISKSLIPLDLPFQLKFEIWLSFDRSVQHSKPVREAINWLNSCFNPKIYPWFSDDFIHPNLFTEKINATRRTSFLNFYE